MVGTDAGRAGGVITRPAVEGWFATDPHPHLLGQRCEACGTVVFPPRAAVCPSPHCAATSMVAVPLSRRGRVWSYATNHYPPPAPYVAADPFEPVTVVAVELAAERLVVLGQLDGDPSRIRVGSEVELTVGTLFQSAEERQTVWRWRPVGGDRGGQP